DLIVTGVQTCALPIWRARADLHDRRAEPDSRRVRADPRERREGVGAPGLGGPHRVVAQPLRLLRDLDEVRVRFALPVSELYPELQSAHVRASSGAHRTPAVRSRAGPPLRA